MKKIILISTLAVSVFVYLAAASAAKERQTVAQLVANTPQPIPTETPSPDGSPVKRQRPNGISVGRPKVFDNRTLTIMLESLSEALRGMQTQFVNQQALAAAFNYIQGFQSKEVASNFNITGSRSPDSSRKLSRQPAM